MPENRILPKKDEDYVYGDLLPLARNVDDGSIDLAWPNSIRSMVDSAMMPGRIMQGEQKPTPEDARQFAMDWAAGGVPAGTTAPKGALGIFAGKKAADPPEDVANRPVLDDYENPKSFEIDDSQAALKRSGDQLRKDASSRDGLITGLLNDAGANWDTPKLGNVLQHQELFRQYPDLKNYRVELDNNRFAGYLGGFSPREQRFELNVGAPSLRDSDDEILKTLLHEAQHAVQAKESWPQGGNPDDFKSLRQHRRDAAFAAEKYHYAKELRDLRLHANSDDEALDQLYEQIKSTGVSNKRADDIVESAEIYADATDVFSASDLQEKANQYLKQYQTLAQADEFDLYKRLQGEVQARNVEQRKNIPPMPKGAGADKPVSPERTQDVPYHRQFRSVGEVKELLRRVRTGQATDEEIELIQEEYDELPVDTVRKSE